MKSKYSIITTLLVLIIIICFSGHSDMNNIYNKIHSLIDSPDLNKLTIEKALGCYLTPVNPPSDEFDLFAPDPEITNSTSTCSLSVVFEEISEIVFEDFKSTTHAERTVTITLKPNSYLEMRQVVQLFGSEQELRTLALNVPENQRCSFVYNGNGYELIFGLKSCKDLESVNRVIIRKVIN
jgi:hypothetical protein